MKVSTSQDRDMTETQFGTNRFTTKILLLSLDLDRFFLL